MSAFHSFLVPVGAPHISRCLLFTLRVYPFVVRSYIGGKGIGMVGRLYGLEDYLKFCSLLFRCNHELVPCSVSLACIPGSLIDNHCSAGLSQRLLDPLGLLEL